MLFCQLFILWMTLFFLILEQPPPPVNDTNPYNVFRPREKSHRLHTRRVRGSNITFFTGWILSHIDARVYSLSLTSLLSPLFVFFFWQMQRRENNVQSFEKLRQVSQERPHFLNTWHLEFWIWWFGNYPIVCIFSELMLLILIAKRSRSVFLGTMKLGMVVLYGKVVILFRIYFLWWGIWLKKTLKF